MLQIKNVSSKLSCKNIIHNYGLAKQILTSKQFGTVKNAANADEDAKSEWAQARPFEKIPTESGLRMIRSFLPGGKHYNKDPTGFMRAVQQEHGDIFAMPAILGRKVKVLTYNPDDFEIVYRNEGIYPERQGSLTVAHHREKYRGDFYQGVEGITSTQGEKWGIFRSAVNPVLMQPKNIRIYLHKMSQVNLEFAEKIKKLRDPQTLEMPDNFVEFINRWALESVGVVALDKQLDLLKDDQDNADIMKFFKNLTNLFTLSYKLDFNPSYWRYFPTPSYKNMMNTLDEILEFNVRHVHEAILRLADERDNGFERPENEKSVLEKLLKIDRKVALVMAIDMLMAGVDTTTTSFTGLLLCLAKNPEKQQKLREEVMKLLPTKSADFREDVFNNMPYLRACLKEALRIYPLAYVLARTVQKDVVLSGFRVPKGTDIMMIRTSLLHNEKYFSRPYEFLPERWLRPEQHKQTTTKASDAPALRTSNPFVYLPFGFGPRSCIGKRLVEMEMELCAARLVRNFNIEFNYSTENAFKCLLINVPNIPLKFKFSDINK